MTDAGFTYDVFTVPERPLKGSQVRPFGPQLAWDPQTATLLLTDDEAALVDVLPTRDEAGQLVSWIKEHGCDLTAIYITHGHIDHYAGLPVILESFPDAQVIATRACVEAMHAQLDAYDTFQSLFGGQLPELDAIRDAIPEPHIEGTFTLDGHEVRIIDQGYTDASESTSLYVPDLGLVIAGDVVYTECHMFLGNTTADSRKNWRRALNALEELHPLAVIAGHKRPGASNTPAAIAASRDYIDEYESLLSTAANDEDLYNQLTAAHPTFAGPQPWLMFGLR